MNKRRHIRKGEIFMGGKEYFRECCKKLGLDCDKLFILSEGNPNNPDRYVFKCDPSRRKGSHIYAIKYFIAEKVYVSWSLKETKAKAKSYYSLSKHEALGLNERLILTPNKSIEYSGWDDETVFVFRKESVINFLKNYIIPIVE